MRALAWWSVTALLAVPGRAVAEHPPLGIGSPVAAEEIARLDVDVMPDGAGLPPGSGTARDGEPIYAVRCAPCHGASGREGPADRLAGGPPAGSFPFGEDPGARRTVGSYWPYATTLFDYIRRAMPPDSPGSLDDGEVYALTAFVLHLDDLVARDVTLDAASLPRITMPARSRFRADDRRGGAEVR